MESKPPEDGLEELLRLSQQMKRTEKEFVRKEKAQAEKIQLTQSLKEIKVTVALEQLKLVADPEIVDVVSSLKYQPNTEKLHKMILDLTAELEKMVDSTSGTNQEVKLFTTPVKTLAILVELLFSLE
ncbi:hypothetical protein ACFLWN_01585 [Chloroflexota bacterium]